ncbi:hypothetical protein FQN54_008538 [Arachnomyces sp. PD_36]|nr:hypothetical protein FQN54_008538 [Arachnomyces sp. PD_36]
MSFVIRRNLSTLIPPKIASPSAIGAAQDAARMERVVGFYEKLPRGPAPEVKASGLFGRYKARYFGKKPSAMQLSSLPMTTPGPMLGKSHFLPPAHPEEKSYHDAETSCHLADSGIVMAEQSNHDVVNQTRSGGDLSPSDVTASTSSDQDTRGDVNGVTTKNQLPSNTRQEPGSSGSDRTATGSEGTVTSGTVSSADISGYLGLLERHLENSNSRLKTQEGKYQQNGESEYDSNTQFNIGEGSGGSDTDTSRTDPKATADERHHARKNSVKKPTTFKPVSFAKFSITKGPGSSPSLKSTSDKPTLSSTSSTASLQQTSRPRLVAKSAGGLRESTPKPANIASKNGSSGPDPSQVWNKNRPTQPPPAKHLTDEELKQQYGIHMTSRILTEGEGKEAKWADIDDDEDDWAPETIEWNDGTKITLSHNDAMSAASQDSKDIKGTRESTPSTDRQTTREPSKVIAPKPSASVGPNATVFKLGANAERNQAKTGATLSKGSTEKPTLTSKSSAPKSPWATLPPVEKLSPIPVNQQQQGQPPSRFSQKDHLDSSSAAPPPAKEIAADDFNRSWRDSQSGFPRELFNSQSGRYEPAPEARRGSARNEQHGRAPSLLQRPPHNDHSGPAEPSAAFQTYRSTPNQDAGQWSRRRTSSNVSGGSGSFGRRMSLGRPDVTGKPNDSIPPRRGSQVNGLVERSISPRGPSNQRRPFAPRGISPGQNQPVPNQVPPGSQAQAPENEAHPQIPQEDPVAMQQRIMREKREMARQRRLEAEAQEEAAKKERIRLKLEAMGPPPSEKGKTQEIPAPAETPKGTAAVPAVVHSPPKPPVPEPSGEPKQYGMMKVHHPESVKKLVAASERVPDKPIQGANQGRRASSPTREGKAEQGSPSMIASANESRPSPNVTGSQPAETYPETSADEKNPQWKGPGYAPNGYSSWAGPKLNTPTTSASSLWGPPSNDKALGNGTFDRNLTGFPPRDLASRNHLAISEQLPIGPPPTSSGGSDRRSAPFSGSSRVGTDNGASLSPLPSPEKRHAVAAGDRIKPIARPGPIAPPTSHPTGPRWHQDQMMRRPETAAWQNFHVTAARVEAEESEKNQRELAARREEEARTGISRASLQPGFNETWRQVDVSEKTGQRQVVGTTKSADTSTPLSPLRGLGTGPDGLSITEATKPVGNSTGRGSRFFPNHTDQQKRSVTYNDQYPRSPSPPPPEEVTSHPVFTGDAQRPLVHFPGPKPVVKLPPQRSSTPPPPATFASMVASGPSLRVVAQPIANTTSWQDRFNGLFGKKSPPQKTNVLEVTSATKEPLEVQSNLVPASVSFPQYGGYEDIDAGMVTSKNVEDEEEMFEDREAGSLPVVRVPDLPLNRSSWETPLPQSHVRLRSKYLKPAQVLSIEPYVFNLSESANGVSIAIRLPGKDVTKTITLPKKGGNTWQNRNRGSSNKPRKGGKPRENSGKYNNPQNTKKHPTAPSNGNANSPRSPLGRGNWTPRVSGVAH